MPADTQIALAKDTTKENTPAGNFFEWLPAEAALAIMRDLPPADLFRVRLVCWAAYNLTPDYSLWRSPRLSIVPQEEATTIQQRIIPFVAAVPAEVDYYYSRTVESLISTRNVDPAQVNQLSLLLAKMREQAITSFASNFEVLLSLLELVKQINTLLGQVQLQNSKKPALTDVKYLTRITPQFSDSARTLLGNGTKTLTFSGSADNMRLLRNNWPAGSNSSVFTKPPLTLADITHNLARAGKRDRSPSASIEAKQQAERDRQDGIKQLMARRANSGTETTPSPIAAFLEADSPAEKATGQAAPVRVTRRTALTRSRRV